MRYSSDREAPSFLPAMFPIVLLILGAIGYLTLSVHGNIKIEEGEEIEYESQEERWRRHLIQECYPLQLRTYDFGKYEYICSEQDHPLATELRRNLSPNPD